MTDYLFLSQHYLPVLTAPVIQRPTSKVLSTDVSILSYIHSSIHSTQALKKHGISPIKITKVSNVAKLLDPFFCPHFISQWNVTELAAPSLVKHCSFGSRENTLVGFPPATWATPIQSSLLASSSVHT